MTDQLDPNADSVGTGAQHDPRLWRSDLLHEGGKLHPEEVREISAMAEAFEDTFDPSYLEEIRWDDNLTDPRHRESTLSKPRLIAEMLHALQLKSKEPIRALQVGGGYDITTRAIALLMPPGSSLRSYEADAKVAAFSAPLVEKFVRRIPVERRPRVTVHGEKFTKQSLAYSPDNKKPNRIIFHTGIGKETLEDLFLGWAEDGTVIVAPVAFPFMRKNPHERQDIKAFIVLGNELREIYSGSKCTFVEFKQEAPHAHTW